MKFIQFNIFLALIIAVSIPEQNLAQEKVGQTGMQFLSVVSNSRVAALGNAVSARELKSNSLFFNPATMGFDTSMIDLSFSINQWIADINHNNASVSISPFNGDYGVFGLSLILVDYGVIEGTVWANNEAGYEDIGNISPSAFSLGLGYSKKLSTAFSVGGQIKYVKQSLGKSTVPGEIDPVSLELLSTKTEENDLSLVAFDFGTLFKTGFNSLQFGMSVRNFSQETKYVSESFETPLTFTFGLATDLMDYAEYISLSNENHSLWISCDVIDTRSRDPQIAVGLEYGLLKKFYLRGGYISNVDEANFNFGVGISYAGLSFDYSYTPYGVFGNIQRLTTSFTY